MVRQTFATTALLALGLGHDPGCGDVDHPKGATNAPCTRTVDCEGDLVCLEGVCTNPRKPAPPADDGGSSSAADGG
jgi:hypothetical protein